MIRRLSTSRGRFGLVLAALGFLVTLPVSAQTAEQDAEDDPIIWDRGPAVAQLGDNLAEVDLSEDYVFLGADDTRRLMQQMQNPITGTEIGTVAPVDQEARWFIVFEFEETGYVDDAEKDELDADVILDSIRSSTMAANEERRERGWATMEILGWQESPYYDENTNNLRWAVIGSTEGHENINRIVKLLGRRGVVTATLVASPDELVAAAAETDVLLTGYRFRPGSTYAEYVPGTDKLATYGLTALVVGGGAAALAKSGLLAKLWKPIAAGLVALGAGIKRLFFSGRSADHGTDEPIG